jgi:uncharacterized protein with HEPN domain
MQRNVRVFLWDARDAARNVIQFTHGKTLENLTSDILLRSAVERQLQNAGEAIAQLASLDVSCAEQIPDFRSIIAFRNILVHNYAGLDYHIVWRIIQEELPGFVDHLTDLLGEK